MSALPSAVREYKIEQLSFFRWTLILEQNVRSLGQVQQPDALFDVALVRVLMRLDVARDAALLGPELGGFAVEEVIVDPAVQLVHVHRIDPVLDAPVLPLQFRDRLFVALALIHVALPQGLGDPGQHLLAERDALQ
ncbi:MAG: hypothetical protein ABSG56_36095 [Bryobacteraceae bacterium]